MEKILDKFPTEFDAVFLTDGGLETTLIFLEGYDLPYFAAFDLLKTEKGYDAIKKYYTRYLEIAKKYKTNFILESPTWRASPDWIEKLNYSKSATFEINQKAVSMLIDLKAEYLNDIETILISGCVGPRGDGYSPGDSMTVEEAQLYHSVQIAALSQTSVDLITAITLTNVEEAIGITRASNAVNLPLVISFTVETDGKLPTGIEKVDESAEVQPLYSMINCAHPMHFGNELLAGKDQAWTRRIKAIRANASCKSHAELDEATQLDRGIPHDLAIQYKKLKDSFGHLNVFGGCCGTDEDHIIEIIKQIKTS